LQAQLQAPDQVDKEMRALQKQAVAQWKAERAAQEAEQQRQEEARQRWQRQQQAEQLQRKRAELKQQIEAAKAAKQQAAEAAAAAAAAQVRCGMSGTWLCTTCCDNLHCVLAWEQLKCGAQMHGGKSMCTCGA
jgi:biotin carboxyl carrier protein